jgi:hypothetical protein
MDNGFVATRPFCIPAIPSYINQGRENGVRKAVIASPYDKNQTKGDDVRMVVIANAVKQSSGRVSSWIASGFAFAMTTTGSVIGNEVKQSSGRVCFWIASGCAFAMTGPFCIPAGRAPSSAGL